MGTMSGRHMPARAWLRYARDTKPAKGRALRGAWAVFIFLGIPLGIMAVLGPLAYAGFYVEPLKQFWRPWPPDYIKGLLAVGGFAGAVALLLYMQGPNGGTRGERPPARPMRATSRRASAWSPWNRSRRPRPHRTKHQSSSSNLRFRRRSTWTSVPGPLSSPPLESFVPCRFAGPDFD